MKFSVVIPSYNSSSTIRRCLESVTKQNTDFSYEIIVVDSSDDETPDIITQEFPDVKLIHLPEKTLPGKARNIGVKHASGDIVAMTDSDCIVEPGWLAALARVYDEQPGVAGVGGVVGIANPDSFPGTIGYLLEFNEFTIGSSAASKRAVPTCNVSFKRSVFEEYGGFPENFFPGEDTAFTWRLTQGGEVIWLTPEAVVLHHNRQAWAQVHRHLFAVGRSFSASRKFDPSLPGAFLLKYSMLARLIPAIRWWRISGRLLRRDLKLFGLFLAATPWVAKGLWLWYKGFREGLQGETK